MEPNIGHGPRGLGRRELLAGAGAGFACLLAAPAWSRDGEAEIFEASLESARARGAPLILLVRPHLADLRAFGFAHARLVSGLAGLALDDWALAEPVCARVEVLGARAPRRARTGPEPLAVLVETRPERGPPLAIAAASAQPADTGGFWSWTRQVGEELTRRLCGLRSERARRVDDLRHAFGTRRFERLARALDSGEPLEPARLLQAAALIRGSAARGSARRDALERAVQARQLENAPPGSRWEVEAPSGPPSAACAGGPCGTAHVPAASRRLLRYWNP
jgi:hypothetical protein